MIVPTGALHRLPWGALPVIAERPLTVAPSVGSWLRARRDDASGDGPRRARRRPRAAGGGRGGRGARPGLPRRRRARPRGGHGRGGAARPSTARRSRTWPRTASCAPTTRSSPRCGSPTGRSRCTTSTRWRARRGVVVLGACDTAASVVGEGDELLGLAAALLRLGSRSLVAPLVPVPDEETRPLLELLHAELARGRDCARGARRGAGRRRRGRGRARSRPRPRSSPSAPDPRSGRRIRRAGRDSRGHVAHRDHPRSHAATAARCTLEPHGRAHDACAPLARGRWRWRLPGRSSSTATRGSSGRCCARTASTTPRRPTSSRPSGCGSWSRSTASASPERLAAWLATTARREALRVLRRGAREAPTESASRPARDLRRAPPATPSPPTRSSAPCSPPSRSSRRAARPCCAC